MRSPALPFVALLLTAAVAPDAAGDERPNIVLVFADDLGQRDLGCYGSPFYETPHVDALAARGVRFTNAYAACPVCSPTRASVYTGRYPARLPLTDWLKGRRQPQDSPILHAEYLDQLPLEQVTVAEELKAAGYRTGFMGKWHLGGEGFLPTDQGFDVNVGGGPNGNPGSFFWPQWGKRVQGLEGEFEGQYITDLLAKKAAGFVTESSKEEAPWFLCVATYQVHTPIQAKADVQAKYEAKRDRLAKEDPRFTQTGGNGREGAPSIPIQNNPRYAAMVESLDDLVGTVVDAVERAGESDNTLIVFFSDNGGLSVSEGPHTPATTNAPLRAGKGYLYEGGIREPLIVAGPGVAEGETCDVPVISNDLRATFLSAAGESQIDPRDGASLNSLLAEPTTHEMQPRPLFWHYPHFSNQGGSPGGAVLDGQWKLIERYEDGALELYNLKQDPSETRNLAARQAEKAEELRAKLSAWRQEVRANMPTANPDAPGPVLER
ncbi:sulfatase [Alienimonas californiensis]|uniref:Arylsulfatase n=1 Tax=Alienimonas californiensis TaxID=2527989 RepID=A0A517P6F9_9PLAN|nr:sulfatase [Alienimonas californiensis]QDT14950.1 Arylsulfatase precursor [Alienimonas californiensis]